MISQAAYSDADVARADVSAWINTVATAKSWSAAQRAAALADIEAAYQTADAASWFGVDVTTFWTTLRERAALAWLGFPNASDVLATLGSAVTTEQTERAEDDANSAATILGGTIEASATDARAAAATATDPKVLAGVAVVLVLVLVLFQKVK